jgi:hypothetical protein
MVVNGPLLGPATGEAFSIAAIAAQTASASSSTSIQAPCSQPLL